MLTSIVEDIYKSYSPLKNLNKSFFPREQEEGFEELIQNKCQHLHDDLKNRVWNEIFGWGPITPLLGEEDLFEIIINGPQHIFIETSEGLKDWHDHFLTPQSYQNFIDALVKESGIVINQRDPFANGHFKGFRVHITAPPITSSFTVTLRKHKKKIIGLDDLKTTNFINDKQYKWLHETINKRENLLVVGPTGSGKTTFLNSLLAAVPEKQRLVIIEDTDELICPSPLSCKLLTRELCPDNLKPYDLQALLKQSLRMRPDRLIIGEIRSEEAKDLLQSLATGHSGSMGTLHAHSAKQAILRLEMLIQMGAPHWSLHSVRQLLKMSLQNIIVLNEDRQNKGIKEICKITSLEKFGLILEEICI